MATLKFNESTFTVHHVVKGSDYIHGYNDNNECIVAIDGISDFSVVEYDGEYVAPDACITETCNEVLCINGVLVRRDGAPLPAGASGASSVKSYGAVGDGVTDDTAAFREALAKSRVVHVPGGTYKLRDKLTIRDNCCLELSQDTVLEFTQTGGACIALMMLASLKGNWATIKVPYEFSGDVLYANSGDTLEADTLNVPPFTKWDPQWKSGRYVTDLNICKADSRGFHYAVEPGDCKGNAVYLSATGTVGLLTFMWGIYYSNLRIAGAFKHGVRAVNFSKGWMHEMRVDAFIDGCEIGVSLEDCNNAYISAVIQPRRAYSMSEVYAPYAKHGIQLIRSKNVDLSGSRVWDWDEKNTLWTDGGEYQHIAMIGECRGAILNDFYYYETSIDIRKQIYTDLASNLEQMTILQEPIDRWFKVRNGEPYYNDGSLEHRLVTQKELNDHFDTGYVKHFTDVLPTAIDKDGSVYNDVGYKNARADSKGNNIEENSAYYMMTGYIACKNGDTLQASGFTFDSGDDNCRVIFFDANFNYIMHVNRGNLMKGSTYYVNYASTDDGFTLIPSGVPELNSVAYARLIVHKRTWTDRPMISINEPIKYAVEGFLADGVKVKGENVVGVPGQTTPDWVATKEESGGDVIVIPEQTVTSGMWSKRQVDIQPGITYEVYINGKRYTCKAYNYDGGIILGNYTIANKNANVPHNNEPFYIYWAGGSATAGMFGKDSTLSYPITLKVTDNIVTAYNKMPEGYLPDGVAMLDDIPQGGGGVDVTASVGQTIVVEEVDNNGKPTKWKAVDYQEKICGIEEAVFLPEVTAEISSDISTFPTTIGMVSGATYKVNWNGVEYNCIAIDTPDGVLIGNIGLVTGTGDTGEPFVLGTVEEDGSYIALALSLNGTMSVTLSITEVKHIPIPTPYLANALPYYIDVVEHTTASVTEENTFTCSAVVSDIEKVFSTGRVIKVRYSVDGVNALPYVSVLDLFLYVRQENGTHILGFGNINIYNAAQSRLYLTPQDDGTYSCSKDIFGG